MNLFEVQSKQTYLERERPWQDDPTAIPDPTTDKYLIFADTNSELDVLDERRIAAQEFNEKYENWQGDYSTSIVGVRKFSDTELELKRVMARKYRERCCDLAVLRNCVCYVSFLCPVHGTHCHGTHD